MTDVKDELAAIEDALETAIDRTRGAQRRVAREIEDHDAPAVASTELVERRADDVRVLVDEDSRHTPIGKGDPGQP